MLSDTGAASSRLPVLPMSLYKSAGLNALGASDVPAGGLLGRCGENLENLAAMCVCIYIYIEYTYIHIERER